jgi:hypothetical protein
MPCAVMECLDIRPYHQSVEMSLVCMSGKINAGAQSFLRSDCLYFRLPIVKDSLPHSSLQAACSILLLQVILLSSGVLLKPGGMLVQQTLLLSCVNVNPRLHVMWCVL